MITDQLGRQEKEKTAGTSAKRQTAGTSGKREKAGTSAKRETEEKREGKSLNSEDGKESDARNRLNSEDRDQEGV